MATAAIVLPWYVMGSSTSEPEPIACPVGVTCPPPYSLWNSTHFYLFGECYVANAASSYDVGSVASCVGFPGEPHTGVLYATVAGLAIGGLALGVVATGLGLQFTFIRRPMKATVVKLAPWLAIVGGVLLLAAPLVLLVGQPPVFTMDSVTFGCGYAGPTQSFMGGCDGNQWNPDVGWILSIGAAIVVFVGALMLYWFGKRLLLHGQIVAAEGSDMKRLKQSIDLPPDVV